MKREDACDHYKIGDRVKLKSKKRTVEITGKFANCFMFSLATAKPKLTGKDLMDMGYEEAYGKHGVYGWEEIEGVD